MDFDLTKDWIKRVWQPHVTSTQQEYLLLLDSYKAHLMGETEELLNDMDTEVKYIAPSTTYLVQPCGVGINKSFKNHFKELLENWRITGTAQIAGSDEEESGSSEQYRAFQNQPEDRHVQGSTRISRLQVAQWVLSSWNQLSAEVVLNSWRSTDFGIL